jgi:hypothetical protein
MSNPFFKGGPPQKGIVNTPLYDVRTLPQNNNSSDDEVEVIAAEGRYDIRTLGLGGPEESDEEETSRPAQAPPSKPPRLSLEPPMAPPRPAGRPAENISPQRSAGSSPQPVRRSEIVNPPPVQPRRETVSATRPVRPPTQAEFLPPVPVRQTLNESTPPPWWELDSIRHNFAIQPWFHGPIDRLVAEARLVYFRIIFYPCISFPLDIITYDSFQSVLTRL